MIVFDRRNVFYLTEFASSLSYLIVTPSEAILLVDGRYIEAARDSVPTAKSASSKRLRRIRPMAQSQFKAKRHRPRRLASRGVSGSSSPNGCPASNGPRRGADPRSPAHQVRRPRSGKSRPAPASTTKFSPMPSKPPFPARPKWISGTRNPPRGRRSRRRGRSFRLHRRRRRIRIETALHAPAPAAPRSVAPDRPRHEVVDHYCSDMTRVVALGGRRPASAPAEGLRGRAGGRRERAGRSRPGRRCCDLHQTAVGRLEARGLARYFTHSLGHGVGLEVHEAPSRQRHLGDRPQTRHGDHARAGRLSPGSRRRPDRRPGRR
jgi:hypothetical protein